MTDLDELYQTIIMDHNKRPRNYGLLDAYTHRAEGYNPICGDKIELRIRIEDEAIVDLQFESACCAICKASASLMTESIKGLKLDAVDHIETVVHAYLSGIALNSDNPLVDGELSALAGVRRFPARVKCAQLPWDTYRAALKGKG